MDYREDRLGAVAVMDGGRVVDQQAVWRMEWPGWRVLGATGLRFGSGERSCHDQHIVNLQLLFSGYGFRATVSMISRAPWVIAISNSTSGVSRL